jgi:hypothetical protein
VAAQLSAFLGGVKSWARKIHTGLLQGSVISPIIFNFFVSDCPTDASIISAYADDFYFGEADSNLQVIETRLNAVLIKVSEWAKAINLVLAPGKSSVTLFTPEPHQSRYHPQVFLDGILLPLNKNPRYLGVIHNTHHNSSAHASGRVQVMKALHGTS